MRLCVELPHPTIGTPLIESLQNPLVKHLVQLREEKKYREQQGSVLITGNKLVREVAAHFAPKMWFVTDISTFSLDGEVYLVTPAVMKKITGLPTPEPIAAEFPLPQPHDLIGKAPLLALDAIRDPGNLGTLVRTALALGWAGVFFLPTCVDLFHEKAIRASRAAPFYLPWQTGTWEELEQLCKTNNLKTYIADMEGVSLKAAPPTHQTLLLLSNEAQGVQERGMKFGQKITIPMQTEMESLNVAIAGAILMYTLNQS